MLQLSLHALQRLADFDARLFLGINRLHSYFRLERIVRQAGGKRVYVQLSEKEGRRPNISAQQHRLLRAPTLEEPPPAHTLLKN